MNHKILSITPVFIILIIVSTPAFSAIFNVNSEPEAWTACAAKASSNPESSATCYQQAVDRVDYGNASTGFINTGWRFPIETACEEPYGLYEESPGVFVCGTPPPVCESPNYIDVVSGECVPPEEFCYTNLESEADDCILIGDEDGDGLNCITDSSGLELCLGDNPLCYTANGQTFCPEPDAVCGLKNGTYNCVNPQEEGCGYFNGERVCFTPDGDKVDPDSPDHPDNGGNLDGNENNDVTDPRDPTEGGDPNNQPGESDTSATDPASEKTARDSLNKLRDIDKGITGVKSALEEGFSSLTEEGNPAQVEGIAQDIANTPIAGLQDLEDGIGLNPLDGNAADGVGNSVTGLVPQGTCSELGFNFNGYAFGLPCDKTQKIRDMLSWVLYFLTVWMLFDIVTSPVVRRA